jgi:hypothetical protein
MLRAGTCLVSIDKDCVRAWPVGGSYANPYDSIENFTPGFNAPMLAQERTLFGYAYCPRAVLT